MQATLWIAAGASALVMVAAALADRARLKRRNLDRVGWAPWPLLQLVALFGTVICAALAIKA